MENTAAKLRAQSEITREYRGFEIVKVGNPRIGCVLNDYPGAYSIFYLLKGDSVVRSATTLKACKAYVNHVLDMTDEQRAHAAAVMAQLRGEVAR